MPTPGEEAAFPEHSGEFKLLEAKRRIAALETENRTLRLEVEQAQCLLDSAVDYAVITLNLGGRITSWNKGASAILGYSEAEILGRSGEILFPAEERAKGMFLTGLCRAMEEGRAANEGWHLRRDGSRFWASGLLMPLVNGDGRIGGFLNILRDNSQVRAQEEHRDLLVTEMGHRVRNALTTVQAIAFQTLRCADVPPEVHASFTDRLIALARSHDLLIHGGWEGAPLAQVAERALSPYMAPDRLWLDGLPVHLPFQAVEILSLGFHELATNAAKYGALSVPGGRVNLCWSLQRDGKGRRLLEITWREQGGPPVVPPIRRGFGSRLLEYGLAHDCGSTVKLDFHPEGLECRICLPITPGDPQAIQDGGEALNSGMIRS